LAEAVSRANAAPLKVGALVLVAIGLAGCGMFRLNVAGEAMSPTLKDGEGALATRSFDRVERGDIVGFRYPRDESKDFVKRVIGLPGERIAIVDGMVRINDEPLAEPYVIDANRSHETLAPVTLAADAYFMMGDNRRNSSDSRMWGAVRRGAIWAKVIGR
jgi:signal peptidase I